MYRVRFTWDNPDSQLGAYDVYQNAVTKADGYYGFCVFDDAGKQLYKSRCTKHVPYRVRKKWADEASQVGAYDVYENAVNKANEVGDISVFDESGKCLYTAKTAVRTMSYKAKLKRNIGSHKKGETVTVTINRQKQWVMTDGTVVKERSYMDLTKQIYDPNCKYSKTVAEAWVNGEGFSSETGWLFWANKYGQRIYIFKGSKGKWALSKTYRCGTGSIKDGDLGDPGLYFNGKIYDHHRTYPGTHGGTLQYFMHYSSPSGNGIHYGSVGKPSTHGCISLSMEPVKWVYTTLPLKTKVILY